MQQSKFLDPSIGLDESVTFHYGLPWVLSLLCELAPKNLKYAKVGWFWCSLAQADPDQNNFVSKWAADGAILL